MRGPAPDPAGYETRFDGTWLVSEYVYSPSGEFSGVVRQTRQLESLDEGGTRVFQDCRPDAALEGGPMAAFRGEHVFDLHPDGHARRYMGPAVIGSGLTWGEGAMTGRGLWPLFGHNFTSFAVMSQPNLQLTGGKFLNGTELVANIVGVATPHAGPDPVWPELGGSTDPCDLSVAWQGSLRRVAPDGSVRFETDLSRRYHRDTAGATLSEEAPGAEALRLVADTSMDDRVRLSGSAAGAPLRGLGKSYGWLTEMELCLQPNRIVEWMEVLDATRGRLVGLRRWWTDATLDHVDVLHLSATDEVEAVAKEGSA